MAACLFVAWSRQDLFDTLEDFCFCSALEVIADKSMYFILPNKELALHVLLASLRMNE